MSQDFFVAKQSDVLRHSEFRRVLFTTGPVHCHGTQLVSMELQKGEVIDSEVHPGLDQVFVIQRGVCEAVLTDAKRAVIVSAGDVLVVPAGTRHEIRNKSQSESLHLLSIYSPPQHPPGTVHENKLDAEEAERKHEGSPASTTCRTCSRSGAMLASAVQVPFCTQECSDKFWSKVIRL